MKKLTNTYSRIYQTQLKPYLLSIPYYLWELSKIRSFNDLSLFIYFKFPFFFPFAAYPLYVTVELTTLCNLGCAHCWRKASVEKRGIGSISIAHFSKIVNEVKIAKPVIFKIGGAGEPALHPHFRSIMTEFDKLKETGIEKVLYTNGTLFQMYTFDDIQSWDIDKIVISVDGIDKTTYEKIRLGGSYDILKLNVSEFYKNRKLKGLRKPQIEVRHVIFPSEQLRHLFKFRNLWSGIADLVRFQSLNQMKAVSVIKHRRHPRREFDIQWNGNAPLAGLPNEFAGNIESSSIGQMWQRTRDKVTNG